MVFDQSKTTFKVGKAFGYILSYAVFTTMLFLIISLSHKESASIITIASITLGITIVGEVLKRLLK